jgi:hypothetical protein
MNKFNEMLDKPVDAVITSILNEPIKPKARSLSDDIVNDITQMTECALTDLYLCIQLLKHKNGKTESVDIITKKYNELSELIRKL